jgi:hypothetical protein
MLSGRVFLLAAFEGEHMKAILFSMATQMLGIKFFFLVIIVNNYYE